MGYVSFREGKKMLSFEEARTMILQGFLKIITHKYPLTSPWIFISVYFGIGAHPTIP